MTKLSSNIQSVFEIQSQQKWVNKASSGAHRIDKLQRLKQAIQLREQDVIQALHVDFRRDAETSETEILMIYSEIEHTAAELADWMAPVEVNPTPYADSRARIITEGRGIVLLFGPWNVPFALLFQPLVSIIAAGNCAMVKPNELAPSISKVAAEIIRDVFDEKDVAVFEGGVDLANEMLELPIDHIFFTGSPSVGRIVMTAAARHLASVTLELGGKNPVIIDRTADLQDAAEKIAVVRNLNNGQVCLCPENIWVPEEMAPEFLTRVQETFQSLYYKDGKLNPDANAKMIDERNFQRVKSYIDDATERGANIIFGGEADTELRSIHPTIMTDVPANAKIMGEETFGPILNVFTYNDVDEAVSSIQQQSKPLALYIFTKNDVFIEMILSKTSSGGVTVNDCAAHFNVPALPFGGVNGSGIGAYHGKHGFTELSHQRSVLIT